MHLSKIGRVCI